LALSDDFDKMAVVVDWLDACRNRKLEGLLDCYAGDASLACDCDSVRISGRTALAAYWRPRLEGLAPTAFGLEEITPVADGVALDYLDHEGKPVRIRFVFDTAGKISHMRCEPVLR
jgi:hypothetical protein